MAPLPVPSATSSYELITVPVVASVNTCSRLGRAPVCPATTVSYASRGVSSAYTIVSLAMTPSIVAALDALAAVAVADAADTAGVRLVSAIGLDWATSVDSTWPDLSVTTTKSPPYTRRPWYVRWYGTYCRPCLEVITGLAAKLSLADACSCAGRAATRAAAPPAARVAGPAACAGAGAACAVPVATAADTAIVTAATAPRVMARLTAVLPSREPARPFGRAPRNAVAQMWQARRCPESRCVGDRPWVCRYLGLVLSSRNRAIRLAVAGGFVAGPQSRQAIRVAPT